MLTAMIGLLVLVYALLAYSGHPLLRAASARWQRPGDRRWLTGWILIALALSLEVVPEAGHQDWWVGQILLGLVGLLLLALAGPRQRGGDRTR